MILNALRETTAAAHQRVEKLLPLMDPSLTVSQYAEVLSWFYSVYRPLELRIADACAGTPLAEEAKVRTKAPWIAQDLAALGWSAERIAGIAPARALPAVVDTATALGCMYVMEGATLGGQYICRAVEKTLHLTPTTGLMFFASYGTRRGAMWSAFRDLVIAAPEDDAPAILAAAAATFACFEQAFHPAAMPAGDLA